MPKYRLTLNPLQTIHEDKAPSYNNGLFSRISQLKAPYAICSSVIPESPPLAAWSEDAFLDSGSTVTLLVVRRKSSSVTSIDSVFEDALPQQSIKTVALSGSNGKGCVDWAVEIAKTAVQN